MQLSDKIMEAEEWLAIYVYVDNNPDSFLSHVIAPLVQTLKDEETISAYFFIRYQDLQGKHVRIRFKCYQSAISRVREIFYARISDVKHTYHIRLMSEVLYEPETGRYGGPEGLSIAESFFFTSSEATLAILEGHDNWSYQHALWEILRVQLSFLYVFGELIDDIPSFLEVILNEWMYGAVLLLEDDKNDMNAKVATIMDAFENAYQKQSAVLLDSLSDFMEEVKSGHVEDEWVNSWLAGCVEVKSQLINCRDTLKVEEEFLHQGEKSNGDLRSILRSYIHMANNRMGVLNLDEAYLSYILYNVFSKIVHQHAI